MQYQMTLWDPSKPYISMFLGYHPWTLSYNAPVSSKCCITLTTFSLFLIVWVWSVSKKKKSTAKVFQAVFHINSFL